MSTSGCPQFRAALALFAGGDLDGPERARVFRHLGECAACRAEYQEHAACREELAALAAGNVPATAGAGRPGAPAVDERFFAALAADVLAEVRSRASAPRRVARAALHRPILVAACAALVLALGLYAWRWHDAASGGFEALPGLERTTRRPLETNNPVRVVGDYRPAVPVRMGGDALRWEGLTPDGWGLLGRLHTLQTLELQLQDDLLVPSTGR